MEVGGWGKGGREGGGLKEGRKSRSELYVNEKVRGAVDEEREDEMKGRHTHEAHIQN